MKCAPDTGPKIKISTANPSTVAVLFSSSCSPVSVGDRAAAAAPEPTTTVTSNAVPTASATNRLTSGRSDGCGNDLTSDMPQPYLRQRQWRQL